MTDILERMRAALSGRYRLDRELGQGGMATVYLAEDLRHDRLVAIKVLHPELAAVLGADRFLTEIKTTAHLQHPNILQLFDSGTADGLLYYVMPFVEGETLRGRLTREKQLPVNEAIAIARGTAAALDYAHRRGVIHRDIKPENILLQDGQALVADFGIALAVKAAGGVRLTQTGLSLGTPQYMSPEQATGEREIDARSDVYALAAVIYEMLAGEPPFNGSSTQAIIAKLMTDEPRPLSTLRRSVPPHIEAAVHRGLEKLPADRWAGAKEFSAALVEVAGMRRREDGKNRRVFAPIAHPGSARPLGQLGVVVTIGILGLLAGRWSSCGSGDDFDPAVPSRLALFPTSESIVSSGLARIIDISQDGKVVAYAGNGLAEDYVALRRLDGAVSTPVPTSDDVRQIRLSPDGRYLYSDRGSDQMQRIDVAGGGWTPVRGLGATPHLDFAPDGTVWWSPSSLTGLHRVSAGADKDEQPFAADSSHGGHQIQQVLPDGRNALVLTRSGENNTGWAEVIDLGSGECRRIFAFSVVEVRYTSGALVYAMPDNTLNAVAFDARRGRVTGEPIVLADSVSLTGAGVAQFAVSRNGTVIYLPTFTRELVEVNRSGAIRVLTPERRNYHSPRYSPDGKRIAVDYSSQDGRNVWVLDRDLQEPPSRITYDSGGHDPVWSRDGRSILYASSKRNTLGIHRIHLGGEQDSDSLLAHAAISYVGSPVGDGTTLVTTVVSNLNGRPNTDIALVRPGKEQPIEPLFPTRFYEGWAAPSPDGKWVAYVSNQTDAYEVYVRPLAKDGMVTRVSLAGGSEPVWSRKGGEIFYRQPKGNRVELVAATLHFSGGGLVVTRKTLFDVSDYEPAQPHANYDVSPDGNHFVMARRSPSTHIVVIQNVGALVEGRR